jgi:hypothetical protein
MQSHLVFKALNTLLFQPYIIKHINLFSGKKNNGQFFGSLFRVDMNAQSATGENFWAEIKKGMAAMKQYPPTDSFALKKITICGPGCQKYFELAGGAPF